MTHVRTGSIAPIVVHAPRRAAVNPAIGWALAATAVVAGWFGWGWPGVVLAVTVTVFWLLLQLSRTLRLMRRAAERPLGAVPSAVMLQARLKTGQRLLDVIALTGSLGEKVADDPETFAWRDAGGDAVHVVLRDGRVSGWSLVRA
jgi:hypothetical protein